MVKMNGVKNNLHQHLGVLFADNFVKTAYHGFHYDGLHQRLRQTSSVVHAPTFEFRNANAATSVATLSSIGNIEIQKHRQEINSPIHSKEYMQQSTFKGVEKNTRSIFAEENTLFKEKPSFQASSELNTTPSVVLVDDIPDSAFLDIDIESTLKLR